MKGLLTLCARGGSKGIPGKNIKEISGQPLIYYSIIVALEFAKLKDIDIYLSTDSEEIRNFVKKLGHTEINTDYIRPDYLATDSAGKIGVILDVKNYSEELNKLSYDYILDLDITSPLRTIDDLCIAFNNLFLDEEAINIFSVSPANRNPYFNMVELNENRYYNLCKKGEFVTRQSSPSVYDLNASFYFYKKIFFEKGNNSVITDKSLIYVVPHLCFDLDHEIDFVFMEYLIDNNKLDFNLLR